MTTALDRVQPPTLVEDYARALRFLQAVKGKKDVKEGAIKIALQKERTAYAKLPADVRLEITKGLVAEQNEKRRVVTQKARESKRQRQEEEAKKKQEEEENRKKEEEDRVRDKRAAKRAALAERVARKKTSNFLLSQ